MANETPSRPPPLMANAIKNFHFDFPHTSLILYAWILWTRWNFTGSVSHCTVSFNRALPAATGLYDDTLHTQETNHQISKCPKRRHHCLDVFMPWYLWPARPNIWHHSHPLLFPKAIWRSKHRGVKWQFSSRKNWSKIGGPPRSDKALEPASNMWLCDANSATVAPPHLSFHRHRHDN